MIKDWNDLSQAVNLPQDIAAVVSTGRKELLPAVARDMNKEEVIMLLNLVSVLLDTNYDLQKHSREIAKQLKELKGNIRGFGNSIERVCDFAEFKSEVIRSRDEEE